MITTEQCLSKEFTFQNPKSDAEKTWMGTLQSHFPLLQWKDISSTLVSPALSMACCMFGVESGVSVVCERNFKIDVLVDCLEK